MGKVKRPTQRDMILKYIQDNGSITAYEAVKEIGCLQLAARLCELKELGYRFEKTTIRTKNRYGYPCHYDEYRLADSEVAS